MEAAALCVAPQNGTIPTPQDFYSKGHKRVKLSHESEKPSKTGSSNMVDYSDPFAVSNMMETLDSGMYGSVTEDIKALLTCKLQVLSPYLQKHPSLSNILWGGEKSSTKGASGAQQNVVIDLDDDDDDVVAHEAPVASNAIVIIDSDDEDIHDQRVVLPFQEVALPKPEGQFVTEKEFNDLQMENKRRGTPQMVPVELGGKKEPDIKKELDIKKDKGTYIGVADEDNDTETVDDGLGDIWNEMSLALECAKEDVEHHSSDDYMESDDELCHHSFILKDDIGYVCRICGVIERGIESIIEVQFYKAKKSTRTSMNPWTAKDRDPKEAIRIQLSEEDLMVTEIAAHPRHLKVMKPHQVEGFNFLCSNLISDNPGGCILAHAPGSGKTFMIISFMQSFLAKYPHARPLVVLPKGILSTWKTEFKRWEVEDIPLLDFYTMKADSRQQQLDILKQWVEEKSILFLGYKQFSSIICDSGSSAATSCQEILLKRPSILILDEGHTPRNENTDVLQSLAKVETPRKVVLSGTLYQNHVKEVFNILNLARPKFLRLDSSKGIVKRIMSKVNISGLRKQIKVSADATFFELVEHTIQKDPDFNRKVSIIRDLREMTSKVLHYYKGDFLDELPGLVDFTVVLNLSNRQRHEVQNLKKLPRKFKRSSVGSAVYLHPNLITVSETVGVTDGKMDELLETMNLRDGAKAKFFFNMLRLCESTGEKLLVFSQYLTPLKFLERLVVNAKGWMMGKEVFVISGDTASDQREWSMNQFNKSPDAKVFFGSIKACGEGISLVGASRILILDVHLNPSVTRQAIGRAFRPGQTKKVYAYRLVAADSPEEEDHSTCFRKEAIAKMWFEWHEYCGYQNFEVEKIDLEESGDPFLESPLVREDIRVLYRR